MSSRESPAFESEIPREVQSVNAVCSYQEGVGVAGDN